MALKEGQCPNCGSLLQLDDKNDQGHCLFCDAVFASEDAFKIAASPAGVTFPNLPQPKYSGPNLNPQLTSAQLAARATQLEAAKKKDSKNSPAKPAEPVYVPRANIKVPNLKLTVRTRLTLSLAALLIIAVVAGISAPMIISRNTTRADLLSVMAKITPVTVDNDKDIVIHGMKNQYLQVALPDAVTADQAAAIFAAYSAERAALMDRDATDFAAASDDLTVKVVTPTGGFLIKRPNSQAAIDDGSAIKTLA
jgi:hypothetical protein